MRLFPFPFCRWKFTLLSLARDRDGQQGRSLSWCWGRSFASSRLRPLAVLGLWPHHAHLCFLAPAPSSFSLSFSLVSQISLCSHLTRMCVIASRLAL